MNMEGYFRRVPDPTSAADRVSARLNALTAPTNALEAVEAHERLLQLSGAATASSALDRLLRKQLNPVWMRDALEPATARIVRELQEREAWRTPPQVSLAARIQKGFDEQQQHWKSIVQPSVLEEVMKAADSASRYALPDALEPYRTSADALAFRLSGLHAAAWWRESAHLDAFVHASAMADAIRSSHGVAHELEVAIRTFSDSAIPELPGLAQHRVFLDAAGLVLRRWPRVRPLTPSEQRRRFKQQLGADAEPPHVRRAKSLVHRYELALRRVIDWVMTEAFGEEWWVERLPLCNCRSLLGRWKSRGGNVLDRADYAHYARIMSHPEHFEAGFNVGFADREALERLILAAGNLRAASHHPSDDAAKFTAKDLRDLRVTWGAIEEGLIALQPDQEFYY
jgi:hypothetical protein